MSPPTLQKLSPRLSAPAPATNSSEAHAIRAILVYGRSYAVPALSTPATLASLLDQPRFFMDVLYCHKKLNKGEQAPETPIVCQEAYDFFLEHFESESEEKPAFIVEVGGSLNRFYQHFAMLLSNPLQRQDQDTFLEQLETPVA